MCATPTQIIRVDGRHRYGVSWEAVSDAAPSTKVEGYDAKTSRGLSHPGIA